MKPKHAVALEYKSAQELPKVLAHGFGTLADQLLTLARQHNIPIEQNSELSTLLKTAAPGRPISEQAQKIVAQILSYLYFCDEKFKANHGFMRAVVEPEPQSAVPIK